MNEDTRHLKATWTIGVDWRGDAFIIKAPDINDDFLECREVEMIGIVPYEFPDHPAGVYEIETQYHESINYELNRVDDWEFVITSMKMIYPETKAMEVQG